MFKHGFKSEQPSKNASFHRLGLPLLSHKPSEAMNKERTMDIGMLPHWNETLSGTDCSSAGRFFTHNEIPKTTRATSHSSKVPKPFISRDSFIAKLSDQLKPENNQIWEIVERIDTCKIRADSGNNSLKSFESIYSKISMWSKCSSEVTAMMKTLNSELSSSLATAHSEIFALFEEYTEIYKESEIKYKTKISELNACVKVLRKNVTDLEKQNSELLRTYKLEDLKIKKEIDDMFPNNEEEIKKLKEESISLRSKKYGQLTGALEKLYNEMNKEQSLPEATEIDFDGLNSEGLVSGLMDKYKVIIKTTVKNVKNTLAKKTSQSHMALQTEGQFVELKVHEDLTKQLEKTFLAYQSALMQLDNRKEESSNKAQLFEKNEVEKSRLKNESMQLKREIDLLHKEIQNLKLDVEHKKTEIAKLHEQNDNKTEQIVDLENRIDAMSEKVLDLSYDLERAKHSRPVSGLFTKKGPQSQNIKEEEPKKNRLDELTSSGLTVREELERSYQSSLAAARKKNQEASMKNLEEESLKNTEKFEAKPQTGKIDSANKDKTLASNKSVEIKKNSNTDTLEMSKTKQLDESIIIKVPDTLDYDDCSFEEPIEVYLEKKKKVKKKSKRPAKFSQSQSKEISEDDTTKKYSKKLESKPKAGSPIKPVEKPAKSIEKFIKNSEKFIKPIERSSRTREKSNKNSSKSTANSSERSSKLSPAHPEASKKKRSSQSQDYNKHIEYSISGQETKENSQKEPSKDETNSIMSHSRYYNQEDIAERSLESSPTEHFKPHNLEKHKNHGKITAYPVGSKSIQIKKFESVGNYEDNSSDFEKSYIKPGMCDKICGKDFISEVSVGVQVDTSRPIQEGSIENPNSYLFPYNPNNIYGLRGDVYYKGATFQPQSRIPDMNSSIVFAPAYKLATNI